MYASILGSLGIRALFYVKSLKNRKHLRRVRFRLLRLSATIGGSVPLLMLALQLHVPNSRDNARITKVMQVYHFSKRNPQEQLEI